MPPATRRGRIAAAAAASAAAEHNRTACPLLAKLPDALLDRLLGKVAEARDRAALARTCRALHAAIEYEEAGAVVAADADEYNPDRWSGGGGRGPATRPRSAADGSRWRDSLHITTRSPNLVPLQDGQLQRLRDIAAAFHPGLRELALPHLGLLPTEVPRLRQALAGAAIHDGRPTRFKKVTVGELHDPDASWAAPGPAGEPVIFAAEYQFFFDHFSSEAVLMQAACYPAAAACLPKGCAVQVWGDAGDEEIVLMAAAAMAEAMAGRGVEMLQLCCFWGVDARLGRAAGAAGAAELSFFDVSLTAEGSYALAGALPAEECVTRRLKCWSGGNVARLLLPALGTRLQRPLDLLKIDEPFSVDDAPAVYLAIAALLPRVAALELEWRHPGTLAVRSTLLRRLSLEYGGEEGELELRFEEAAERDLLAGAFAVV